MISIGSIIRYIYRQTSDIRHTKSKDLNVSLLLFQLSLLNQLKPDVKSKMKMWLEQRRQAQKINHTRCRGTSNAKSPTRGQNDHHFAAIFRNIFMNENICILILISVQIGSY